MTSGLFPSHQKLVEYARLKGLAVDQYVITLAKGLGSVAPARPGERDVPTPAVKKDYLRYEKFGLLAAVLTYTVGLVVYLRSISVVDSMDLPIMFSFEFL